MTDVMWPGRPGEPGGAGIRTYPCTANEQCQYGEYCAASSCDGPGGCAPEDSEDCGVTLEPVCGCDGTSYTSAACASSRGVRVKATGECVK